MDINCSLNCKFENNGKCTLYKLEPLSYTSTKECIYFQEKKSELRNHNYNFYPPIE